jgi:hypothetical protein
LQALCAARAYRHETSNRLRAAVSRMRNALISRALNTWLVALEEGRERRAKLRAALAMWRGRWGGQPGRGLLVVIAVQLGCNAGELSPDVAHHVSGAES